MTSKRSFSGALGLALLTLSGAANPDPIAATGDSFTKSGSPARNYGGASVLHVSTWNRRTSYLQFQQPAGSSVDSATLRFAVKNVDNAGYVDVHLVQSNWSESGITANTSPILDPLPIATAYIGSTDEGSTLSVNVTPAVQAWLAAPNANFGLALAPSSRESISVSLHSSESSRPPTLDVSVSGSGGTTNRSPTAVDDAFDAGSAAGPLPLDVLANDTDPDLPGDAIRITNVGATSDGGNVVNNVSALSYSPIAGFSGVESFAYTLSDEAGATSTATVRVTVAAADNTPPLTGNVTAGVTADSFTKSGNAGKNYGGNSTLHISTWNSRTIYLKFDIAELLGGAVDSATLNVVAKGVSNAGYADVHVVQSAWTERGITANAVPIIDPGPIGSIRFDSADGGSTKSADITAAVQGWVASPGTNHGLALVPSARESISVSVHSRETSRPPSLLVALAGGGGSGDGGGDDGGGQGGGGSNKTWRIMPIGDSITEASGSRNSYRRPLWHALDDAGYNTNFVGSRSGNRDGPVPNPDFDTDHEGHWGWKADRFLNNNNLGNWAQNAQPDIALIHLGTNDIFNGQSVSGTVSEIGQIIDVLRSVNPHVMILVAQIIPTSDPGRPSLDPFNAALPQLVSSKNTARSPVRLVDQDAGFNASADTYDGVHPDLSGEIKIANKWFAALVPLIVD